MFDWPNVETKSFENLLNKVERNDTEDFSYFFEKEIYLCKKLLLLELLDQVQ